MFTHFDGNNTKRQDTFVYAEGLTKCIIKSRLVDTFTLQIDTKGR